MDYVDKNIGLWKRGDYRIHVACLTIQYEIFGVGINAYM